MNEQALWANFPKVKEGPNEEEVDEDEPVSLLQSYPGAP